MFQVLPGTLKKLILSLFEKMGYGIVNLRKNKYAVVKAHADDSGNGAAPFVWHEDLVLTDSNLQEALGFYESLCRDEAAAAGILARAGEQLLDYYFRLQDKNRESSRAIARKATVLIKKAIDLAPDRFADYRRLWTAHYYLGEKTHAYDLMNAMSARQAQAAKLLYLDRLGIRFLSEQFITNIGVITHLEVYLKAMMLGLVKQNDLILLLKTYRPANESFLKYFSPFVRIVSDPDMVNRLSSFEPYLADDIHWAIPINGVPTPLSRAATEVRRLWHEAKRPPLLKLEMEHEVRGIKRLRSLGFPENGWFVGLHMRESRKSDDLYRDVIVDSYAQAIEEIVSRGGWVVRIGDGATTPLPSQKGVIDLAHSEGEPDWMDIFVIAKSRLFISTGSGPGGVPYSFGVPNLLTNYMPIATIASTPGDLVMPKMVYSERENRLLTFRELFSVPVADFNFQYEYESLELRSVDNTPEEIHAAVVEMFDRLDSAFPLTHEVDELQRKFRNISSECRTETGGKIYSDLPGLFLRNYADLLT